jgi:hypothetical protein
MAPRATFSKSVKIARVRVSESDDINYVVFVPTKGEVLQIAS